MRPSEAAAVLDITPGEVVALVRSGELDALHIGYWFVIREKDVEEYIARQLPEMAS